MALVTKNDVTQISDADGIIIANKNQQFKFTQL